MRILIVVLMILQGCASISECDYDLDRNGWHSAEQVPKELIDDRNKDYLWFTNSEGDFFACPKLKRKGLCGGFYATFEKKADGSYEDDLIVCIE